jgi:general stress protein CsbA
MVVAVAAGVMVVVVHRLTRPCGVGVLRGVILLAASSFKSLCGDASLFVWVTLDFMFMSP